MQDGNLSNTTFTVTKVADAGGGHHFDVVVEADVVNPTGARAFMPFGTPNASTITAKVMRYATAAQVGATQDMSPGAGVKYTATIQVDDADLPVGDWIYAIAEAKWVVDGSDSEAASPKRAPA